MPGRITNGSPRLAAIGQPELPAGIMICGHGSRDAGAVAEFAVLAQGLRARFPDLPVEYGYLEFARPIIREGLDKLIAAGARDILAVPGMLFAAGHAKNDIPSVLNTYAVGQPGVTIRYGRELGIDPRMIRAAGARIRQALDAAPSDVPLHDTVLLVVGRGASDPDANSNVAKVTRMLWEGFGFGWAETAYSGVTFPLVAPALDKVAKLGFRRVVVFPYFLFTGILVQRIYDAADEAALRFPDLQILKAPYLNDHPLVLDTFVERVREIGEGQNLMNCQLCKYREQVLGFEAEVGLPQESHHHHVEGISADLAPAAERLQEANAFRGPERPVQGANVGRGRAHDHGHDHRHEHPAGHHHHDGHTHHAHEEHRHDHAHDNDHGHSHGHAPDHGHTHHPYPHADHPLGPRSLKRR